MVNSSMECGNHAEICPINSSVDSEWINGEALNSHCEGKSLNGEQMVCAYMGSPLTGEQVESIAMQTAEHHTENGILCNDVDEELNSCNTTNNNCEGTVGDWRLYWDNDYQRNYFYNMVTMQCTWNPPPGMDDLVFTNFTTKQQETALEMVELDVADFNESMICKLLQVYSLTLTLQTELKRMMYCWTDNSMDQRKLGNLLTICVLLALKTEKESQKGEIQMEVANRSSRYLLFNKYDEGIKMDEEGWFSVTPEAIAKHHALRCGSGTIVDFLTGVSGNSIQFAKRSKHVIAIDIDPKIINLAQYNASIYGVRDQIDFIRGDSFVLAPNLKELPLQHWQGNCLQSCYVPPEKC
ncbi:hypothetical protein K7X08_013770 [Anisodus acutangulus]|uniref:Trimethylguanosine synthase n=1 Tax=Anisodus acutangulus TaxID=402998 RepID=A0A9Q1LP37_9SOLA|nr:hypothetical protein K7X08_013770 [Anisodus acutangulus]